jgi:ABC-type sulfate transport system permease component
MLVVVLKLTLDSLLGIIVALVFVSKCLSIRFATAHLSLLEAPLELFDLSCA